MNISLFGLKRTSGNTSSSNGGVKPVDEQVKKNPSPIIISPDQDEDHPLSVKRYLSLDMSDGVYFSWMSAQEIYDEAITLGVRTEVLPKLMSDAYTINEEAMRWSISRIRRAYGGGRRILFNSLMHAGSHAGLESIALAHTGRSEWSMEASSKIRQAMLQGLSYAESSRNKNGAKTDITKRYSYFIAKRMLNDLEGSVPGFDFLMALEIMTRKRFDPTDDESEIAQCYYDFINRSKTNYLGFANEARARYVTGNLDVNKPFSVIGSGVALDVHDAYSAYVKESFSVAMIAQKDYFIKQGLGDNAYLMSSLENRPLGDYECRSLHLDAQSLNDIKANGYSMGVPLNGYAFDDKGRHI